MICGNSQHGFTRGESCLTNLVSFYYNVLHLVDQGKAVDIIFLDFSNAFDAVSNSIILDKTPSIQLNKTIMQWVRQMDQTQRVTVNGIIAGWWPVTSGVPSTSLHFRASSP